MILLAIALLAGCSNIKDSREKPIITVTIEPLRYFTEAIAGDKFKVISMVPAGTSPETYDPTPLQMVSLSHSKAYMQIGYIGFELVNIDKLKANTPNLKYFDTSDGIELIHNQYSPHKHNIHHHGHIHGLIDPHIWNSTKNAEVITKNLCKALCEIDSTNFEYYTNRCDSMLKVIEETDKEIRKTLAKANKSFLIYHPALTYFAQEYNLKQICIEKDGKEPSPSHLKELINECKESDTKIIFMQKEFNTSNALIIAEELKASIIEINPLNYDWRNEMLKIAKSLKE